MSQYFINIFKGIKAFMGGMSLTLKHMNQKKKFVATMQYPQEKWPIPEKDIGFDHNEYNLIRSRLHVDIDDCIGCLQCERACPVDCIKIDTVKPPKESEFDCGKTSYDTQKKMIVPRFTIDMSECMYCNLCVYPCPEDCIYMVGGPNEEKHEIDYEFSKYERNGLIFEFATSTDEEIIAAGGETYLKERETKKRNLAKGKELKGELIEKEDSSEKLKSETELAQQKTDSKPDIKLLNIIEDRMTRAIAKKAFLGIIKTTQNPDDIVNTIIDELKKADKFDDSIGNKIKELKVSLEGSSDPDINQESGFSIRSFNSLEDKMARGICKKIFLSGTKEEKKPALIAKDISRELKEKDLMTDDVKEIIKEMIMSKASVAPKKEGNLFDIKALNVIEDKMVRGLAKKIYLMGKKQGKNSSDIINDITKELTKNNKIDEQISALLQGLAK